MLRLLLSWYPDGSVVTRIAYRRRMFINGFEM